MSGHPSRRTFLGHVAGAGAVIVTLPAMATPVGLDAELLRLCAKSAAIYEESDRIVAQLHAAGHHGPTDLTRELEDDLGDVVELHCDSIEDIAAVPAFTREGLAAKAVALRRAMLVADAGNDAHDQLTRSLISDLTNAGP